MGTLFTPLQRMEEPPLAEGPWGEDLEVLGGRGLIGTQQSPQWP